MEVISIFTEASYVGKGGETRPHKNDIIWLDVNDYINQKETKKKRLLSKLNNHLTNAGMSFSDLKKKYRENPEEVKKVLYKVLSGFNENYNILFENITEWNFNYKAVLKKLQTNVPDESNNSTWEEEEPLSDMSKIIDKLKKHVYIDDSDEQNIVVDKFLGKVINTDDSSKLVTVSILKRTGKRSYFSGETKWIDTKEKITLPYSTISSIQRRASDNTLAAKLKSKISKIVNP